MIKDLQKIGWTEVVRSWATAESVSKRRLPYLISKLDSSLVEKLEKEKLDEISEEEWIQLDKMVQENRKEFLSDLKDLNLEWYKGKLSFSEIQELLIMKWKPFVDLSKSQKFSDLVEAFRRGEMPDKHLEFAKYQKELSERFDINKMQGAPIVLSESTNLPYYLIEGFTRLSALLLSGVRIDSVPIILGVGKVMEWKYLK